MSVVVVLVGLLGVAVGWTVAVVVGAGWGPSGSRVVLGVKEQVGKLVEGLAEASWGWACVDCSAKSFPGEERGQEAARGLARCHEARNGHRVVLVPQAEVDRVGEGASVLGGWLGGVNGAEETFRCVCGYPAEGPGLGSHVRVAHPRAYRRWKEMDVPLREFIEMAREEVDGVAVGGSS